MQLIIPAFNEEGRLPDTLRALRTYVLAATDGPGPVDVIVVDNASTDRTAEVAGRLDSAALPVRVIHCARRGKGAAVSAGVAASDADIVAFMDADGATELSALAAGVNIIEAGGDVAVASRALPDSITYERHSRIRELGAGVYRRMTRSVVPDVVDTQCGFKVFRGDLAREVFAGTRTSGFSFDVEVLGRCSAMGAKIVEFPVTWVDVPGSSFTPARHGVSSFVQLADIAWRMRRAQADRMPRVSPDRRPAAGAATPGWGVARASAGGGELRTLRGRRIAVVNWRDPWHSLAGGAELYAWEFARALVDAGARVDFVTARDRGQSVHEQVDGVRVARRGGQLTFYPWALWWLLLHRRRLDAVLDADCGIPVFSPLVLARRRTAIILLVHHVHLDQFSTYFPPALASLGRFLEGWLMPRLYRGRTTVAVSASTLHEMRERLGWTGPVTLLHNGNTLGAPPRVQDREPDRLVVLGRLAAHKRVDQVVLAVSRLLPLRPELRLDIIGKGPGLEPIRDLIAERRMEHSVRLHGFLDDETKWDLLSRSRLHISASDVEGWGQVVIEAAATGTPTLARDVPGLRDSIVDGVTGWLLDERDGVDADLPTRLAQGIDRALVDLDDPARRTTMGTACVQWASGYSWETMHRSAVEPRLARCRRSRLTTRQVTRTVELVWTTDPRSHHNWGVRCAIPVCGPANLPALALGAPVRGCSRAPSTWERESHTCVELLARCYSGWARSCW